MLTYNPPDTSRSHMTQTVDRSRAGPRGPTRRRWSRPGKPPDRAGPGNPMNHQNRIHGNIRNETKENNMKARHPIPFRNLSVALAGLLLAAAFWVPAVEANTAANATIRNTVTVNFNDAGGNPQTAVTATANITVNLVKAAPTLSAPANLTTDPATNAVYNYTITANANGPDTYNLSTVVTEPAGITGTTATPSVASIILGATTAATAVNIPAATPTDIIVPSDLVGGSGAVNGIAIGDTVIIGGNVFTVNSITDNGGVGTSIINVTGATATNVAIGDLIAERGNFTVTVDPGTVTTTGDKLVTVDTTATAQGSALSATDQTVTTVQVAALTVVKEVSTDGATGATYAASATGNPGDTLTYRITVSNTGTSNATSVVIRDPTPQFTTYVAGSAKSHNAAGATYAAAATALTDANPADDGYDWNINTTNASTYNVGTLAPAAVRVLYFQVTIQ